MNLQFGVNMPASNIKRMLEKNNKQQSGIRTWRQLFGGASLDFGAKKDALTSDYSSAIAEAYKANFERKNSILGLGLSQGNTERYIGMTQQELFNTYNKFMENYAANLQQAASDYAKEVTDYDNALTERATNFANLFNKAYDYLKTELYGATRNRNMMNEDGTPVLEMSGKGKKAKPIKDENGQNIIRTEQVEYLKENGLDWLLVSAEEASKDSSLVEGQLKDWNTIAKDYIFDSDMQLTEQGKLFFDAIFNASPQQFVTNGEPTRSFDKWLSDTDSDLREWLVSQDPFNYTFAGTNRGTANVILGGESEQMKQNVPQQILKNAKDSGYDNMLKSRLSKGINTIENVNKKYADELARIEKARSDYESNIFIKLIDQSQGIGGAFQSAFQSAFQNTWEIGVQDLVKDYAKDYNKTMNANIKNFKSELTKLLDENMAEDFWKNYGGNIDKIYKEAKEIISKATKSGELKYAKELQKLDFDKTLNQLYRDLKLYINITYDRNKKNPSGF